MAYRFRETDSQAANDLCNQIVKVFKKARRCSFISRHRYFPASIRFAKWAQPTFHLQKIKNIQDKHMIAYGKYLKSQGKTDKYIKNELAGLRYLHENTPNTRFKLGNSEKVNKEAGLGSTPNHKAKIKNQACTKAELEEFCQFAIKHDWPKLALMALITAMFGTRLNEIATLRRDQIERALRTGQLYLDKSHTKGGRPREVPVPYPARILLQMVIQDVPRGAYVFVPADEEVYLFKKRVQNYIYDNRSEFQDPTRPGDPNRVELHWHCFRHYFAQQKYQEFRNKGMSDYGARKELTKILGHGRVEVTFVYVP